MQSKTKRGKARLAKQSLAGVIDTNYYSEGPSRALRVKILSNIAQQYCGVIDTVIGATIVAPITKIRFCEAKPVRYYG